MLFRSGDGQYGIKNKCKIYQINTSNDTMTVKESKNLSIQGYSHPDSIAFGPGGNRAYVHVEIGRASCRERV